MKFITNYKDLVKNVKENISYCNCNLNTELKFPPQWFETSEVKQKCVSSAREKNLYLLC